MPLGVLPSRSCVLTVDARFCLPLSLAKNNSRSTLYKVETKLEPPLGC
jgi:hypothetical protein